MSSTEKMCNLKDRVDRLESLVTIANRALIQSKYAVLDKLYERTLVGRALVCVVCGYQAIRESFDMRIAQCQFGGGRLERYLCPRCGVLFGPMKILEMAGGELDDEYRLLYAGYAEGDCTDDEIRTFLSLKPKAGGLYLNWGCGAWSKSIDSLRAKGWDVWGYEPLAQNGGQYLARSRGEISAHFDGIFSNNVIEHFVDPVEQFVDFARILKPDGLMAHSTPCYEYRCQDTRFHTVFYLGDSIDHLAELTGFKVLMREVDGQYINAVLQKKAEIGDNGS